MRDHERALFCRTFSPGAGDAWRADSGGAGTDRSGGDLKGKLVLFGGIDQARFKGKVVPGDVLMLETEIIKRKGPIGVGSAKATVNGKLVAKAELTFAVTDPE